MASVREQGNAMFKNKQFREAIAFYERALEEEQDKAAILLNLSLARSKIGESDLALQDVERAITLKPTWGKAWCRKAMLLQTMDHKRALEAILYADNISRLENNEETKVFTTLREQLYTAGNKVVLSPLFSARTPQPVLQTCSSLLPVRNFIRFVTPLINNHVNQYYNTTSTDGHEMIEVIAKHPELDLEVLSKLTVGEFIAKGGTFYYQEVVTKLDVNVHIIDQEGKVTMQLVDAQLPYDSLQQNLLSEKEAQNGVSIILRTTLPMPINPTVADFNGSGGFAMRLNVDIKGMKQQLAELREKNDALEAEVAKYKAEIGVLKMKPT